MSTSPTYALSDVDLAFALCEVFSWPWVEVWNYRQLVLVVALEGYFALLRQRKGGWSIPREESVYSTFGPADRG